MNLIFVFTTWSGVFSSYKALTKKNENGNRYLCITYDYAFILIFFGPFRGTYFFMLCFGRICRKKNTHELCVVREAFSWRVNTTHKSHYMSREVSKSFLMHLVGPLWHTNFKLRYKRQIKVERESKKNNNSDYIWFAQEWWKPFTITVIITRRIEKKNIYSAWVEVMKMITKLISK